MRTIQLATVRPTPAAAAPVLRGVKPNSPFDVVIDHTWEWTWDHATQTGEWLPSIRCVRRTQGVNGNTRAKPTQYRNHMVQSNMCTAVDPADPRLGDFQHFVGKVPVRGGAWYGFRWVKWHSLQNGRQWVAQADMAMDRQFRQKLAGLYAIEMDPASLTSVVGRLQGQINRIEKRARDGHLTASSAGELIATREKQIAAARQAAEDIVPVEVMTVGATAVPMGEMMGTRAALARERAAQKVSPGGDA